MTHTCVAAPAHAAHPADELRFSAVLREMTQRLGNGRVTIGDLIDAFGKRGHAALLILLGAPNMLPLPLPGLSMLSGLPLLFVTVQIALGRPVPWCPDRLRARSIDRADFLRITGFVLPRLERLERIVRPRWSVLTMGLPRRTLGVFAMLLAVTLILPLPFGNGLPGLALAIIGLALLERDGLLVIVGGVTGLAGAAVVALAGAAIVGMLSFLPGIS
jgi:hypothetical protein